MTSTLPPTSRVTHIFQAHSFLGAGRLPALIAFVLVLSGLLAPTAAQIATTPAEAVAATSNQQTAAVPDDPLGRGTPRSSVERFFGAAREGDFVQAANYLDLTDVPAASRATQGPQLARQFWIVLERQTKIDFSTLSINPLGESNDGLPPNRERLAQIQWTGGFVELTLERLREPNTLEVWKVSSRSVGEIPKLYSRFRLTFAEQLFSETTVNWLLRTHVLGLSIITWIGLIWAILVWAILILVSVKVAKRAIKHVRPGMTANLLSTLYVPAIVIILTALLRSLVPQRAISEDVAGILRGRTVLIAVAIWILFRLADFGAERARTRLLERDSHTGFHLINLMRRVAKVAFVVVGSIVWLDNMGFKVSTIIASLGIIGLAVGLASQKFIEDLIAAMTLHATGVVKRDEAIRFGDQRGIVEDIGLRMITIRSRDRTLITMPNAAFATMQIENFGRRDKFLFQPRLTLRYETTPDQLRYVLIELRKLLYAHPKVMNDNVRVRFVNFGASSLDLDVFCYISETIDTEYLAVAEDLNLRIMDIVARAGTSFAYPSQTIYFERGQGPDEVLSRQAEEEVRRWREQGQLFLHKFNDETIRQLSGTLTYPDRGTSPISPKTS